LSSAIVVAAVERRAHLRAQGSARRDYAISKVAGEEHVAAATNNSDVKAVALRPPMVYGEGMHGKPLLFFRHLRRGLPLPVARPVATRSVMYVGNLAEAVYVAATHAGVEGPFSVADDPAPTIDTFGQQVAESLGRRVRLLPLPRWLFGAAGLKSLADDFVLDTAAFTLRSGYRPLYTLGEGIARTAEWLRREKN
jgi:UDP-glucose 4-epimerase